jgi:hypothetical protein
MMLRQTNPPRPVQPGAYSGTIVECSLTAFPWRKSALNPDGLLVRIGANFDAEDGPATAFDAIDITSTDRLESFLQAVGAAFTREDLSQLGSLVGTPARFVTRNITPAQGRGAGQPKAVITSWISTQAPGAGNSPTGTRAVR